MRNRLALSVQSPVGAFAFWIAVVLVLVGVGIIIQAGFSLFPGDTLRWVRLIASGIAGAVIGNRSYALFSVLRREGRTLRREQAEQIDKMRDMG